MERKPFFLRAVVSAFINVTGGHRFVRATALAILAVVFVQVPRVGLADDARIYVIREVDGTIRFTNRPPAPEQVAEVFTARSNRVSYYSPSSRRVVGRIYRNRYDEAILRAAEEHSLDPALIKAVIHAESAFNPQAVSPKGALGLMQLMPGTARMMGVRNAFVPESNIAGGTRYLAQLIKRHGRLDHALAAYNAGDVPVQRYNGIPPFAETRNYVRRVLQLKKQYTASSHG
jgi:soluble lytic murein transglycosylase-like protein